MVTVFSRTDLDIPEVYDWAKAATKPSYNFTEIQGTVPSSALPSYVDDVLEYSSVNNFPVTGESDKIYIDTSTNLTYRWGGTTYVQISSSLALGTTSSTAYRGDYGDAAYQHAVTNRGSAFTNGLYKITTNNEGHVTAASAVVKADITALGIADQSIISTTGTLLSTGWNSSNIQTINITGVSLDNIIIISPTDSSKEDYVENGVWCNGQSSNSLTFICETIPTNNINLKILIINSN